jgi:predicted  nucleic acid-binding Zn-ribbon protein
LERKAEDDRINAFTQYMGLLQKDMNKYNSELANLDAAIASLTDRIDSTTNAQNDVV